MQWRMTAQLSQGGELRLDLAGNESDAGRATDAWTPVDFLAAAVAGCFVKSCHIVLQALGEAERLIEAHVELEKFDVKPSRVGKVRIRYVIDGLDTDRAVRIAKDAKRICTVTNTLNCEFELAI